METEPLVISIIVPEGSLPGTKLEYTAPDGQDLCLVLPSNVPPGSLMTLTQDPLSRRWQCVAEPPAPEVPPATPPWPQGTACCAGSSHVASSFVYPPPRVMPKEPLMSNSEDQPATFSIVVPEGAAPGVTLHHLAPDGQDLRLTLPDNVPPGSLMTLIQDPFTRTWKCIAEPAEIAEPVAPHRAFAVDPRMGSPWWEPGTLQGPRGGPGEWAFVGAQAGDALSSTFPRRRPAEPVATPPTLMRSAGPRPSLGGGTRHDAGQHMRASSPAARMPAPLPSADWRPHTPPRTLHRQESSYVPPSFAMASYAPPPAMPQQALSYQPPAPSVQPCLGQQPSYTPPPSVLQYPSYAPPPVAVMDHQLSPVKVSRHVVHSSAQSPLEYTSKPAFVQHYPSSVPPVAIPSNRPSYIPPVVIGGALPVSSAPTPLPIGASRAGPAEVVPVPGLLDTSCIRLPPIGLDLPPWVQPLIGTPPLGVPPFGLPADARAGEFDGVLRTSWLQSLGNVSGMPGLMPQGMESAFTPSMLQMPLVASG